MSQVNSRSSRFFNWRWTLMLLVLCLEVDGYSTKVQTKFGAIRGFWSKTVKGSLTVSYLGIPYAEPPIGDLRFRSPQPWTRKWNNTYDATVDGNKCIQIESDEHVGTEDCLYLNIFVPVLTEKTQRRIKLPVLVFVHGGRYMEGSSTTPLFRPQQLMDQNVVFVTLNYRLNIMGFFSTESRIAPGNNGLKDIVMALRWVQENIEVFHGDPKSVTLWGNSAGATAVHTLSFSKKTEGLFHRYIIQSGSIFAPWNVNPKNWIRQTSLGVAEMLDCLPQGLKTSTVGLRNGERNTEDQYCPAKNSNFSKLEEEMMSCMRSLDEKTIGGVLNHFDAGKLRPYSPFGPVIEEESEDAVITAHPMETVKKREFRDLPCIVGLVRDEGLVPALRLKDDLEELKNNFEEYILIWTQMYNKAIDRDKFISSVKEFYFASNVSELRLENLTQVIGDSTIIWPVYQILRHQSRVMKSSIFFYFFMYDGSFSCTAMFDTRVHYGIAHGDDLEYLIPVLHRKYKDLQWTATDVTVSDIMTTMWGSFAVTGVPRAPNEMYWPDYRSAHEYLIIGNGKEPKLSVGNSFLPDRMAFWIEVMNDTVEIDDQGNATQPEATLPSGDASDSCSSQDCNNLLVFLLILLTLSLRAPAFADIHATSFVYDRRHLPASTG